MNPYCQLAKDSINAFITTKKVMEPSNDLPKTFFVQKAGVFVSIYNKKELRGCVGTYLPTKDNLAKEIISSSISACKDSRFYPIETKELPFLSFEVYILEEPRIIKDLKDLDPKKYGILILTSNKSGLLLPNIEGVDTVEQQIEIACDKAGINIKNEEISIFKFLAKKYVSN
jgi:AmmeMemoRadiSam system protein A